jgi:hypothetical protein
MNLLELRANGLRLMACLIYLFFASMAIAKKDTPLTKLVWPGRPGCGTGVRKKQRLLDVDLWTN